MDEVCTDEAIIEGVPVCPQSSLEDVEDAEGYEPKQTRDLTEDEDNGAEQYSESDDGMVEGLGNADGDSQDSEKQKLTCLSTGEKYKFGGQEINIPLDDVDELDFLKPDAEIIVDEWFSTCDVPPGRPHFDPELDAGKHEGVSEWPCSSSMMLERIDPSLSPVLEEKYNWAQDHRDKDLIFHVEQVAAMSREDLEEKLMDMQSHSLRKDNTTKLSDSLHGSLSHAHSLVSAELENQSTGSDNSRRLLLERAQGAEKELISAIDALTNNADNSNDSAANQDKSNTCEVHAMFNKMQPDDHDIKTSTKEDLVKMHEEEVKVMQHQFREKYCRLHRDLIAGFSGRSTNYEKQLQALRTEVGEREAALEGQYMVHEKELRDIADEHTREAAGLLQKIRERDQRYSKMKREYESDLSKLRDKLKVPEPVVCKCCKQSIKQISVRSDSMIGRVMSPAVRDTRVSSGKMTSARAPSGKSLHAFTTIQEISKDRKTGKPTVPSSWCPRFCEVNTGSLTAFPKRSHTEGKVTKVDEKTCGNVQGHMTPSPPAMPEDALPCLPSDRKSPMKTQSARQASSSPKYTDGVPGSVKPPAIHTEH